MTSPAEHTSPPTNPPELLLHFEPAGVNRSQIRTAIVSAVLQGIGLVWLSGVQFEATPPRPVNLQQLSARRVTPLVAPPDIRNLTQRAPQTKEVAKEFDVQSLTPRPEVKKAPPPKPAVSPNPRQAAATPALPDAPQIAAASAPAIQLPPPGLGTSNQPPPPAPQIQPAEKPKIAFESIAGSGRSSGNVSGGQSSPKVNIPIPRANLDEAVARVSRRPGGGVVVGDDADSVPSLGESLGQRAAPGRMGSSLELLSDPQGADFRPYLLRVLSAVRRNWFAVIPESARMGRTGKVLIQFAINRDGGVPKLVIAVPSGLDPLDRAAVAGISASNPFPPLPVEYKGDQIRLQLSFVYNGRMR